YNPNKEVPLTATVAQVFRRISSQRVMQAEVIIEFGGGIRIQTSTSTRVMKANGIDRNTNCAYRTHPIYDVKSIKREVKTDTFTRELVKSFVDEIHEQIDNYLKEAEDHLATIEAI